MSCFHAFLCPYGSLATPKDEMKIPLHFPEKTLASLMDAEKTSSALASISLQVSTAKRDFLRKDADTVRIGKVLENECYASIREAADGAANYEDFWYAASVQAKCEAIVAKQILTVAPDIETWVATKQEKRKRSRDKHPKTVEVVLLPAFVFFRLPLRLHDRKYKYEPLLGIRQLTKVHGLVMETDREYGEWEGAHIPGMQIERLKYMLKMSDTPVDVEAKPLYAKGDAVRVVRGSLAGLEGTICRDDDGKDRLYITLDNIGYASTEISRLDVEYIRRRRGRPCKDIAK